MSILKKKMTRQEVESHVKEIKNEYENAALKQKERIFELKSQLTGLEKQLDNYREREAQISKALTFAVQKASDIEEAAKRKYNLEIEHLRSFHDKWKAYYNQLIVKYPIDNTIKEIQEFNQQMSKIFSGGIENLDNQDNPDNSGGNLKGVFESEKKRVNNSEAIVQKVSEVLQSTEPQERYEKIVKTATRKKPAGAKEELAYYKQIVPEDTFTPPQNIVNYLEKEEDALKAETGNIEIKDRRSPSGARMKSHIPVSESGFSFEEALNPTQDLEDIMKDLGLIFDGDLE